ncbi:MAG: MBL fold metallo-hydrolase [Silicimonas sp.]|nr:MBL fold metallo-hydrolase [Silicimonas sp.]
MTMPEPGKSETLEDGLRRILAPNPGPMTHWGTNTFVIGEGRVAIVDPGPESASHLDAIRRATRGETITHILVTHAHLDHSSLTRRIARETGALVHAFGPAHAGRTEIMNILARQGLVGGGEGIDEAFRPDIAINDGDRIDGDGWQVQALHSPGHFAGHLAFSYQGTLISGDHVMDWSSSLVSPPDGDLAAFMATSRRLRDGGHRRLYPAHGLAIDDPADRLNWLIGHRQARETAILASLSAIPRSVEWITERVYADIPPNMLPAAMRNVFAHLIDLSERDLVAALPHLAFDARFTRV